MIGILLLIVRFVKSSDQAIIQIIGKNKSILTFLIKGTVMQIKKALKNDRLRVSKTS